VGDVLVCETEWIASVAVVQVRGPLRINTVPTLRAEVHKCLAADPGAVVVDVAGVEGREDLALTVFPALARAAAAWPGVDVFVAGPDADLRERLSMLAVRRFVQVAADRDAALAAARAGRRSPMARYSLSAGPEAVTEARAAVRELCGERGLTGVVDAAEVVTSELVSNAVVHARAPYLFAIRVGGSYLHLSVRDGSAAVPVRIGEAGSRSNGGGFGLMLVEALTVAWGVSAGDDGKVVWATLSLRPASRPGRGS
jgi:anti-anti-sigma regulatory factor/anti-sigma regulatory factor (Ser/Thr protein kinase)